jgi:predicted transcriptional regulator
MDNFVVKRPFARKKSSLEIKHSILSVLKKKKNTVSAISNKANIHRNTCLNHLNELESLGIVEERISLSNCRIFGLTELGKRI